METTFYFGLLKLLRSHRNRLGWSCDFGRVDVILAGLLTSFERRFRGLGPKLNDPTLKGLTREQRAELQSYWIPRLLMAALWAENTFNPFLEAFYTLSADLGTLRTSSCIQFLKMRLRSDFAELFGDELRAPYWSWSIEPSRASRIFFRTHTRPVAPAYATRAYVHRERNIVLSVTLESAQHIGELLLVLRQASDQTADFLRRCLADASLWPTEQDLRQVAEEQLRSSIRSKLRASFLSREERVWIATHPTELPSLLALS